ncbi:MAG TPA: hypothetical protein VGX23_17790 [Actinocrinis sp.]|nr:hypothetical protein [Actinocrinis sp.]
MTGIRWFGQRKSGQAAPDGDSPAPEAADLAEVWEKVRFAATSSTWQCRHSGETIVAEGSVDFDRQISRAAVILGKGKPLTYVFDATTGYRAADEEETAWESFRQTDPCGRHAYTMPEVLALALRGAGGLQAAKPVEIDGKMLRRYSTTLKPKPTDPEKRIAWLARQLRDHGANALVLGGYTDEAGEFVRLRFELPHWTPVDAPNEDHLVTVELFDLGTPVELQVPEEAAARRSRRSCTDLTMF